MSINRIVESGKMRKTNGSTASNCWVGGVIGPYFFEDEHGNAETVNGDHYRNMISNFLWPYLDEMDTEEMWFQPDGVTYHTSETTIKLFREKFDGDSFPFMAISSVHQDRVM